MHLPERSHGCSQLAARLRLSERRWTSAGDRGVGWQNDAFWLPLRLRRVHPIWCNVVTLLPLNIGQSGLNPLA